MRRVICSVALIAGFLLLPFEKGVPGVVATPAAAEDPHAYFNSLVAAATHWKSYSLRDQAQLLGPKEGGYAQRAAPLSVTYDPTGDKYHTPQDGAKVLVPSFTDAQGTRLTANVTATETVIALSNRPGTIIVNGSLKIDDEVMKIVVPGNPVTVQRGQFGTKISAHAAGAPVLAVTNSIGNQVWLPMGTVSGHTYLTTWDAWFGPENRLVVTGQTGWKTFQFRRQGPRNPSIWFEVRTRLDKAPTPDDVGTIDARGYSAFGPNVTRDQPLSPMSGEFVIRPGVWVRHWMLLDQRQADFDLISLWAADEHTDPVLLYDRMQFVNDVPVESFQLEFNSSSDRLPMLRPDMVSYVRNVVILKDVANPRSLFLRPIAGPSLPKPAAAAPMSAPRNLRVSPR